MVNDDSNGSEPSQEPKNRRFRNTDIEQKKAEQNHLIVRETTAWIPEIPSADLRSKAPALKKPIVLPRVDTTWLLKVPLPFIRAYSEELAAYEVHKKDFLAFIDNLAVAQAPPVLLQVLGTAGDALGYIPHDWAQIAGLGMNVIAGLGTAASTRFRTKHFMGKVNRDYFAPRGLKAEICKHAVLMEKLAWHKEMPCLVPIDFEHGPHSLRDRAMKAMDPYIAPLTFDVPVPAEQRRFLDRVAAKQIGSGMKREEKKSRKKARRMKRKGGWHFVPEIVPKFSFDLGGGGSSTESSSSSGSSSDIGGIDMGGIEMKSELELETEIELGGGKGKGKAAKGKKTEGQVGKVLRRGEKWAGDMAAKKRDSLVHMYDERKVGKMEFVVIESLNLEGD